MHDPCTVAHEIKYPWKGKPDKFYPKGRRDTFITIWHNDPEKDGTDDSCGWFMRPSHGDREMLDRIKKDFLFDWTHGWYDENDKPLQSVMSIALGMFSQGSWRFHGSNRRKHEKFLKDHIAAILRFAENPVDIMFNTLTGKYGGTRQDRIESCASMVYGCLLRWTRPWYKEPRWHVHHWSFQIHPWQNLKRRFWTKCSKCKKRGFKKEHGGACGNWSGTETWHTTCNPTIAACTNTPA